MMKAMRTTIYRGVFATLIVMVVSPAVVAFSVNRIVGSHILSVRAISTATATTTTTTSKMFAVRPGSDGTGDNTTEGNRRSSSSTNNGNRQQKPPRFSQDAHSSRQKPVVKSSGRRAASKTEGGRPGDNYRGGPRPRRDDFFNDYDAGNDFGSSFRNDSPRRTGGGSAYSTTSSMRDTRRPQQKLQQPRRSSFRSSPGSGPVGRRNDDLMWKSKQSIEDLESTMMKRFGNEVSRWAADPKQYEFVYDNETGRKERDEKTKTPGGWKPVKDPWGETNGKSSSSSKIEKPFNDFQSDKGFDNDEESFDEELDFDDESFDFGVQDDRNESGLAGNNRIGNVKTIISSRPVGGVGATPDVSSAPSGGSFFFQKPSEPTQNVGRSNKTQGSLSSDNGRMSASSAMAPPREQQQQPRKQGQQRKAAIIEDKDGNPILLSVHEAQKRFNEGVAAAAAGEKKDQSQGQELYQSKNTNEGNQDEEAEEQDDGEMTTQNIVPTADSRKVQWEDLGITSQILLDNLYEMGCPSPLSVQEKACAPILAGSDVLVGTYTGSGKTLAFLTPLVQKMLIRGETDTLQLVVVAPGRELASQIVSVARDLLQGTGLSVMLAIGGTTFGRNLEQIRKKKPSVIVGTPGRLAELIVGKPGERSGRLKLQSLQSVVLDECDALLEYKPHRAPTKGLVAVIKQRHRGSTQFVLCSATASDMMKGSVALDEYLRPGYSVAFADQDDRFVTSGNEAKAQTRVSRTVMHGVVHVPHQRMALDFIRRILHTEPCPQQILIFADNARKAGIVVEKLANMNILAAPLFGGPKSEKLDRAEISKALRDGTVGVVVATELAARGLDAPLLTHVINLDLPTDASHYAHRAGRCGRGGRPGVVINMTTDRKERMVPQKFADRLGIEMHTIEPRSGKLVLVEDAEMIDDYSY